MGKASRRKRERRSAKTSKQPVLEGHRAPVLVSEDSEDDDPLLSRKRGWGGLRPGAGRPRVYVDAAARQAAYRARRRVTLEDRSDQQGGKPPNGGAPEINASHLGSTRATPTTTPRAYGIRDDSRSLNLVHKSPRSSEITLRSSPLGCSPKRSGKPGQRLPGSRESRDSQSDDLVAAERDTKCTVLLQTRF